MKARLCLLFLLSSTSCPADDLRVAVASNFAAALNALAEPFEAATHHRVIAIPGSTGKHYAQIRNGAPFDVFLAADADRPGRLEQEERIVPATRYTYALGALVLWSSDPETVDAEGRVLENGTYRHLAIANPRLAPYGRAAREVLEARNLWSSLQDRLAFGENINQTFHFVRSRNAELGLVARSQVVRKDRPVSGSTWDVPKSLYAPIEQQAVILKDGEAARAFHAFLRGEEALTIIRDYGYDTP